jgi:hypothetical protein
MRVALRSSMLPQGLTFTTSALSVITMVFWLLALRVVGLGIWEALGASILVCIFQWMDSWIVLTKRLFRRIGARDYETRFHRP